MIAIIPEQVDKNEPLLPCKIWRVCGRAHGDKNHPLHISFNSIHKEDVRTGVIPQNPRNESFRVAISPKITPAEIDVFTIKSQT